jgi:hypothetical protein
MSIITLSITQGWQTKNYKTVTKLSKL